MRNKLAKIGLVMLLTVILAVGCNKTAPKTENKEPETKTETQTETKISEGYSVEGVELAAYSLVPSRGEFGVWTTEEIEKEGIPINLEETYKIGDNQWIAGFFAPVDPADKDTVYFSTQMLDATGVDVLPDGKVLNRILSYNLKTGATKELYKEERNGILRTIGIDGNKVIVMYDGVDNSPGPCFSVWANWKDFGYIDITKPEAGLNSYTIPDYKIKEAQDAAKECEEELYK